MWIFHVAFVVALSGSVLTFPQSGIPSGFDEYTELDGFTFDGPVDRPSGGSVQDRNTMTSNAPSTTSRTTTTTTSPAPAPTPAATQDQCIRMCPKTPEYNPICGTDGVVYDSPGQMTCAVQCGRDVSIGYYGPCTVTKSSGR
ncbi:uncharacterized protein LOC143183804 [Calliopsis andreniformis]|uniref:uncharacterized protein LOC143183804 n=1 Tax=Calliopsis andreniformis TaxID=337506 RepID=UPI003FCD89DB